MVKSKQLEEELKGRESVRLLVYLLGFLSTVDFMLTLPVLRAKLLKSVITDSYDPEYLLETIDALEVPL